MEAVNKNCEEDSFLLHLKGNRYPLQNPLTNLKYHFVVTTAMLTRYCIDGGLEPEQAYRLSDFLHSENGFLHNYLSFSSTESLYSGIRKFHWSDSKKVG